MIDVHAHILPKIDDGARTWDEASEMLMQAKKIGISRIVATPHIWDGKEDFAYIRRQYDALKEKANQLGIQLYLGYEVHIHVLSRLDSVERVCFDLELHHGQRFILIELYYDTHPRDVVCFLSEWVRRGITPILAHPECYAFVQQEPRAVSEFRSYGCIVQLDASSLMLPFWDQQRRTAVRLLREKFIDCIASDAHCREDYVRMGQVQKRLRGKMPSCVELAE